MDIQHDLICGFLCIQGVESFSVEWLLSSIFPLYAANTGFLGIHIHDACFAAPQHCHRADKQKDAPGNMRRVDRSRYTCRRRSHSPATCHGDGYNVIWFVMLYFIAAFIRKYDVTVPKNGFSSRFLPISQRL